MSLLNADIERRVVLAPRGRAISLGVSLLAHLAFVAVMVYVSALGIGIKKETERIKDFDIVYVPSQRITFPTSDKPVGGGGGGGEKIVEPATKGKLPKRIPVQITPPVSIPKNVEPELPEEPTVLVPPEIEIENIEIPDFGDLLSGVESDAVSPGPGSEGGIGEGVGGGVGSGSGSGVGPGEGGGIGGGAYQVGGGVSAPVLIYKVEPLYSDEARKAKIQGTVILSVIVGDDGFVREAEIVVSVGYGLDEAAMDAVRTWRFKPGEKDGAPVSVRAIIEVSFRLL